MRELCDYWQNKFDWRAQEMAINQFAHFHTEIDGIDIHFIHERGKGENPMPVMLLHGWPSSFLQMQKIIPLLADPKSHGGSAADAFDVIVPSLPGYGFSDRPREKGMSVSRIAVLFQELMVDQLGYKSFAVRGRDMGAGVAVQMAIAHPYSRVALHMSGTNPSIPYIPPDLSPAEQQFIKDAENWRNTESGYALEQRTRPQTLAYGLNDSPVGLAAWIVEKFRIWSDCEGNVENRFSKDELLSNITIYWAKETIGSSIRLYYESTHDLTATWGRVEGQTAMAMLPKDLFPHPKRWVKPLC
ncbi:MAG: epoxide hydrolase [Methanotrichaceae archaeon]|jgi:pimeloyl-ACP methyl ester carboxylesterase